MPQGLPSEAARSVGIAQGHIADYPRRQQAHVLTATRCLTANRGETEHGTELCERALAIYLELEDAGGVCRELINRASFAGDRGELARQRIALEEYARDHNVRGSLPEAFGNLGDLAIQEGGLMIPVRCARRASP